MPFMMPLASCDANASSSGVKCPQCHITPYFDHLNLGNNMMPLASHDANTCANAVK